MRSCGLQQKFWPVGGARRTQEADSRTSAAGKLWTSEPDFWNKNRAEGLLAHCWQKHPPLWIMALWGAGRDCCALKWNQPRLQSGLKTQQSSKGKQTQPRRLLGGFRGCSLSFTAPWDGLMKSEHADLRALPVLQLVGGTSGPRGSDCVVIVIPGVWN